MKDLFFLLTLFYFNFCFIQAQVKLEVKNQNVKYKSFSYEQLNENTFKISITDENDEQITGLTKNDFRVVKNKKEGEEVVFDQVLLLENEKGEIEIGQPYLENKTLKGKILETGRDKKVVVFRYHNKTRYRKKKGHRQEFMKVEILS